VLSRRVQLGRVTFLVAVTAQGEVIGYAQAGHRKEEGDAELYALYVLPAHQGRGAGWLLLTSALDRLRAEKPVRRLFVQVERENEIGLRFYRRQGFTPVRAYQDNLFGHESPMLELVLTVTPT
jgi:ribosomal protein S18 acetylase RimI-like enzyme